MSNPLKKLASQTAIYGLTTIIGRLMTWFLVPIYIGAAKFSTDQYGIITEMYSYVAFLVVFLTYGMETAYFRYSTQKDESKQKVYTTIIYSLLATSFIFISVAFLFNQSIADWLKYPNNKEFVTWFAIIVGLDAVSSIPMARLRAENKATKFVIVNFANIIVFVGLNLFFLAYCRPMHASGKTNWIIDTFYNPNIGVGYVFISNLIASIIKFVLLLPEMIYAKYGFELSLLKKMFIYALPLLIFGLAGIVNETIDRIMLKRMLFDVLGEKETLSQIGIYGACYKVSIIITLFIQAFRYAAEPFFFAQEKEVNAKENYSKVMTYFVIVCATIFLGVMLFIDVVKYFIPNEAFWEGLHVVPILMFANISLGIYYNQSIWYKLSGKTKYGAYIGIFGALITIALNYVWIPVYGYVGSAWATLICYFSMMLLSFILSRKHYPIKYDLPKIFLYLTISFGFYLISSYIDLTSGFLKYSVHSLLLIAFAAIIYLIERPKKVVI
ncbi:polysaccharide biosynthesis protein [Vicingus serpentipes]|uniref:Polysaccharide biosynthesis protein n=1 Tax=Vicingus serpentipes TaxID=1926625 RepID=A0A5C6RRZ9_9FLAO|nr:oligosaccharide flippase family protein [Vicingus serpentipes]TXB64695.1 polysaccharide biosynthesis protein [Vicingus serpentipes]